MTYSSEVLADSPLAYWRLGEAAPSTTMADSSGNGRDGTYTEDDILGATSLLTGDSDAGINPQGVTGALNNGHGTIASASWMDVTSITLECWIRLDGAQSNRALLSRFNAGQDWLLWIDASSKIAARFYNTSGSQVNIAWSTTPSTSVIYHVVATYQSGQARLYIDGTQVDSSTALTGNLRAAANAINVGTYQDSNSFRFNGTIDEAAIYSGELSSTRIGDHYTAGSTVPPVDLAPADASHNHTVESPALTQTHELAPTDSAHTQSAEPAALTQVHELAPVDTAHTHAVEAPSLTQTHELAPTDALHAHTVESPATIIELVPSDTNHAHSVDVALLTQTHELTPADALHGHGADSSTVTPYIATPTPATRTSTAVTSPRTSTAVASSRTSTAAASSRTSSN